MVDFSHLDALSLRLSNERGYLAVLEALADVGADEDQKAYEADFAEVDE